MSSGESIIQERMSEPQLPEEKPHSSEEIILDKTEPLEKTDSLINTNNGHSGKEDAANISDISSRSMCNEEQSSSENQEEEQAQEELKMNIDKYFPNSQDMADIQESSEEDKDDFNEDPSRDKGCFTALGSLPSNLQPQSYKNAMEIIRGAKNSIRQLLCQLYETIDLTYQSKQDSEDQQNCHKALFELWINWSKSQSENVDGDTELLETRALGMTQILALKLQSAFMDLLPKVQGLPSSLQDKLQQACFDMQEVHNTFTLSSRFKDIDKPQLTQSQFKLTQAQGSLEELFCFLEQSFPSDWIVGPLSTSEYPFPNMIVPKEKVLNCDMESDCINNCTL
ncbi:perilipin-3-like [Macrotis lagotis]|uniref:perilipin-3-like n=1 Tax=Macrotis lagotis TaxID=92651 RepID=UPI003D6994C2